MMSGKKFKLIISISYADCTGCASCQALCPELFEIRDDGKCWVTKDVIEGTKEEIDAIVNKIKEAIEVCPVCGITYQIIEE